MNLCLLISHWQIVFSASSNYYYLVILKLETADSLLANALIDMFKKNTLNAMGSDLNRRILLRLKYLYKLHLNKPVK